MRGDGEAEGMQRSSTHENNAKRKFYNTRRNSSLQPRAKCSMKEEREEEEKKGIEDRCVVLCGS